MKNRLDPLSLGEQRQIEKVRRTVHVEDAPLVPVEQKEHADGTKVAGEGHRGREANHLLKHLCEHACVEVKENIERGMIRSVRDLNSTCYASCSARKTNHVGAVRRLGRVENFSVGHRSHRAPQMQKAQDRFNNWERKG